MNCRLCGSPISRIVCDLNHAPPSNGYLSSKELNLPEIYYPLRVLVCESCWLMQIDQYKQAIDIFSRDYRYFSSYSISWVNHAYEYVSMIIPRLGLHQKSKVLEIASNDGYLLQFFVENGIPCIGVDPATGPAESAEERGIETIRDFFSIRVAQEIIDKNGTQDLVIGNNVLAHVPDINGFVESLKLILSPEGTITMEFPHILELLRKVQFDTIYHEHYSYLSLMTVLELFSRHRLRIYDIERLPTHGGSLRIYACHAESKRYPCNKTVTDCIAEEKKYGLNTSERYIDFQKKVEEITEKFMSFLLEKKQDGKLVIGYGAAAKGNTLLNACGIKGTNLIRYVVDASPHKQGFFLPGSHIPIYHPNRIKEDKPDVVIVFPWNISSEISSNLKYISEWGGILVAPIPSITILR
ncbi:class I SAM-dependent methyltransferase [Methanospirillum lacunae]|uniref:SAM-dependent methyltransferase n=1 Tax=Methanospirillum lacunae TaxID=668570 RepID=A0A2V2N5Y5_9EURY|nr:class I SAM-dependent methyltransferase [Methanospirillum lacunae]PWR70703.1 SAM-dependent methyltransferase [Methanospirillum lacunae]